MRKSVGQRIPEKEIANFQFNVFCDVADILKVMEQHHSFDQFPNSMVLPWPIPRQHEAVWFFSTVSGHVNEEMLMFYWSLGRDINFRQNENSYGSDFFRILSVDMKKDLPFIHGVVWWLRGKGGRVNHAGSLAITICDPGFWKELRTPEFNQFFFRDILKKYGYPQKYHE